MYEMPLVSTYETLSATMTLDGSGCFFNATMTLDGDTSHINNCCTERFICAIDNGVYTTQQPK